jgi:hypothetical protein
LSKTLDELSKQAFVYECASRALAGVSLTHFLRAQAFRLVHNLGALLKACWLPVEKVQQRVWASLQASGHAEYARNGSETP